MEQPARRVIEVKGLQKSFGDLDVLHGVDLVAEKGKVVTLIGSSGSGKSTLLRCCNLLENSQDGEILFDGVPVEWTTKKAEREPANAKQVIEIRTNLAMVFQQFNLWSHMTILENVIEAPISVLKRDRDETIKLARALLDKVGVVDKVDFYPSQLSGGQQQRVAIARALAMQPKALLFDEPTSALDPELEQEVVRVIKALAKEGRTMIIVTHDMRLAADVSDVVIFLHQGKVEEQGPPSEVLKRPKSKRLQQFLSASAAA